MTREMNFDCPNCGGHITVRVKTESAGGGGSPSPEQAAKIWAAVDDMWRGVDKAFAKIFHPSLWK